MTNGEYPRLCGGVFFRILLGYRKQRLSQKAYYSGESDPLSNIQVLLRLIRVTCSDFQVPKNTTIKANTSSFLNCRQEIPGTLPFEDSGFIASFRGQMDNQYPELLFRMHSFLESVIGLDDEYRLVSLVMEILEIMEHDLRCAAAKFRIGPKGEQCSLAEISDISFQSFILGIWYYIITRGVSNKVDPQVYDTWEQSQNKGQTVTRSIKIRVQDLAEPTAASEQKDEAYRMPVDKEQDVIDIETVDAQEFEVPFYDPVSDQNIKVRFHVENHGSGAAIGINYGSINIGKNKKDE